MERSPRTWDDKPKGSAFPYIGRRSR